MSNDPESPKFSQSLFSQDDSPERNLELKLEDSSPEKSAKSASYQNNTSTPQNSPRYRATETPSPTDSTSSLSTCLSTSTLESTNKSFLLPVRLEDMEVSGLDCSANAVTSGSVKSFNSENSSQLSASLKQRGTLLKKAVDAANRKRSSSIHASDIPDKATKYQSDCENGISDDETTKPMTVNILIVYLKNIQKIFF